MFGREGVVDFFGKEPWCAAGGDFVAKAAETEATEVQCNSGKAGF
jgi:hypothetical protein